MSCSRWKETIRLVKVPKIEVTKGTGNTSIKVLVNIEDLNSRFKFCTGTHSLLVVEQVKEAVVLRCRCSCGTRHAPLQDQGTFGALVALHEIRERRFGAIQRVRCDLVLIWCQITVEVGVER